MAVTPSTMSPLGSAAPDFSLPDTISGLSVPHLNRIAGRHDIKTEG